MTKNILIICGSFPPQSFVGGLRPAMFAKYLPKFGWDPWVLTRDFTPEDPRYDEKMSINLPQSLKEKIIKIKYSLENEKDYLESRNYLTIIRDFFYPEYSCPPGLFFAVKPVADTLMIKFHFDLIFSTSPDQWELTLGSYLSAKYKVPLVADFRDITEQEEGLKRTLRQKVQVVRFLIRRYLATRQAVQIITVSKFHKATLQRKLKRNCSIVYNGFEELEVKTFYHENTNHDSFRIIYVGRILGTWYQNPEILFRSIDELINEGKITIADISVEFYGSDKGKLITIINSISNPDFIKFNDRIPFPDVPKKLNEAQMLLLLTNRDRKGILTTKFFEYTGVKKPILCIPGDNHELDELIKKYNLGYSISEVNDLKFKLLKWIKSFREGTFPAHISSNMEVFTRENQTRILANVFNGLIG